MKNRVDLIIFNKVLSGVDWNLGSVYYLDKSSENLKIEFQKLKEIQDTDYFLFWNKSTSAPKEEVIKNLCTINYDVFHGSHWETENLEPRYLDFVNPIWIYNLQGEISKSFSSFRCLHNSTLVRVESFKRDFDVKSLNSLEFSFLDFGYKILKGGGIIRYEPLLNPENKSITKPLSKKDNALFIKKHFSKKWSFYSNCRAFLSNFSATSTKSQLKWKKKGIDFKTKSISHKEGFAISVLAPTLDRYKYIQSTINQLQLQSLKPLEILITDQTKKSRRQKLSISKLEVPVRYFIQEESGQVMAWNKLIAESKGDYLLFLGDDADNIYPDFCKDLAESLIKNKSDMMAARVIEKGIKYNSIPTGIVMSDTFPITLIKKSVVVDAGCYNMFFNKGIRADADLAIRCHLNGALMLLNNDIEIFHHRAPAGGLRAHKQRKTTFYMSQNNVRDYIIPTETEFYIALKYFTKRQVKEYMLSKKIALFTVKGTIFKKLFKIVYISLSYIIIHFKIENNKVKAMKEISN